MRSVLTVNRAENEFCDICTRKATTHVIIGKQYMYSLDAMQFWICDKFRKKMIKALQGEADYEVD